MAQDIQHIRIVDLLDEETSPSGHGALYNVVFQLSSDPPMQWVEIFENEWLHVWYSMKREVRIYGDRLEVHAPLGEIDSYHLPQLRAVFDKVNEKFTSHIAQAEAARAREDEESARRRAEVAALKGSIKFD